MKDLSLIGKISIVSGIFFASYGLLLFMKDMKEKSTLINFLNSSGRTYCSWYIYIFISILLQETKIKVEVQNGLWRDLWDVKRKELRKF
ncbi:hypothetical protein [Bacillus smithii]|uniref:Uncharacterized protein n=1 Tax=Bacillus smithii 7_3_47FAA TaxID=665952 RepID=G9QIT2_9BACI|nr:hypothetical protein [Bacillus smithii]EHL78933.1 hypothetical protein HMPREF1015_03009 [Bacillus smithii 7_3_47FAA]